jgi:hypothetical protein
LAAAPHKNNVEGSTHTMLLMPIVNCSLCALYIFTFLWLGIDDPLFGLLVALAVMWIIVAATVVIQKIKIVESSSQVIYVLFCTVLLMILLLVLFSYEPPRRLSLSASGTWPQFMIQNWGKMVLFAGCLGAVVFVSDFLSKLISYDFVSSLLGTLGGFPLVPFFGLYTVASESRTLIDRHEIFGSFAVSVWFGPVIAFAFIMLFSRYLLRRNLYNRQGQWVHRFGLALPFWVGCFAVIVPTALLMEYLKR